MLSTEQIVSIARDLALVAIVLWFLYQNSKSHKEIVGVLLDTIKEMRADPVAMQTARDVGQSVPQAAFDKLYGLADGLAGLLGASTPVGSLIKQAEDLGKAIDHDPTNDPNAPAEPPPFKALDGTAVG